MFFHGLVQEHETNGNHAHQTSSLALTDSLSGANRTVCNIAREACTSIKNTNTSSGDGMPQLSSPAAVANMAAQNVARSALAG